MTYEIERAFIRHQIERRELAGDPKTAKSIAELREEMEERHGLAWPAAVIEAMGWQAAMSEFRKTYNQDGRS